MKQDFDLGALAAALDARRQERGMTWAGVARELAARFGGSPGLTRPVAASTISGIGRRPVAEGDGVLQMLIWLDRSPESFVPGRAGADVSDGFLQDLPVGSVPRWDTAALHRALDEQRGARGLTWTQAAAEIGGLITAANLTGLTRASRVSFPSVMRLVAWLDRPAAEFVRGSAA